MLYLLTVSSLLVRLSSRDFLMFLPLEKGNNKLVFFYKVLVILAEPFAIMIFEYITWVIIFRIKRKNISKTSDFKYNMLLTIIVIIYLLQPGIIKLVLELFK